MHNDGSLCLPKFYVIGLFTSFMFLPRSNLLFSYMLSRIYLGICDSKDPFPALSWFWHSFNFSCNRSRECLLVSGWHRSTFFILLHFTHQISFEGNAMHPGESMVVKMEKRDCVKRKRRKHVEWCKEAQEGHQQSKGKQKGATNVMSYTDERLLLILQSCTFLLLVCQSFILMCQTYMRNSQEKIYFGAYRCKYDK